MAMTFEKENFLGLESDSEHSKVVILPIPYEATTTYIRGAQKGPEAILRASQNLELYDEELQIEPYKIGIATLNPVQVSNNNPKEAILQIASHCQGLLQKGKFVISLGGEHSISVGLVKAHLEKYPSLSVLQLDAHADLREEYLGSAYNHACTMARINELCPSVGVGIRSLSAEEACTIKKANLNLSYAYEMTGNGEWIDQVISQLTDYVYITLDLDYFDPSIMPSVGTPEPGGLLWYETLALLKEVTRRKNVVGFDVVELCPGEGFVAPDFLAAKLIYKLIGFVFEWEFKTKSGGLTEK